MSATHFYYPVYVNSYGNFSKASFIVGDVAAFPDVNNEPGEYNVKVSNMTETATGL